MNADIIVAVLSSTAVATVLGNILQIIIESIKTKIERDKINEERQYEIEKEKRGKKEEIYIKALEYSLIVRRVLDAYKDKEKHSESELESMIEEMNKMEKDVAPFIKLYSSKLIFESFRRLSKSIRIIESNVPVTEEYIKATEGEEDFLTKLIKQDINC